MSAPFTAAVSVAQQICTSQDWPAGTLYMVATPIGNLADLSLRALHVLQHCTTLACEDTRHSQNLLRNAGIDTQNKYWFALHQHNEAQGSEEVLQRLQSGERVAYISDAGTPGVSDPGARLAALAHANGIRVCPIPGASSVTALLSACGAPLSQSPGFVFVGFLPTKHTERDVAITQIQNDSRTQVILEAPHRIEALAQQLSVLGERTLTVGRELTKQYEEIHNLSAQDFSAWLQGNANRTRGEFVLVIHAQLSTTTTTVEQHQPMLARVLQDLPLKTAVKLVADITGASRNELYDLALKLKRADAPSDH
jgi:16S rRNA (cytidine1402-2'-O)-methyltransferase